MSAVEPASPLDGFDWLQRDRERRRQLEIPGADLYGERREVALLGHQQALDALRQVNRLQTKQLQLALKREELKVKGDKFELAKRKRIEKQEAAMGWIQVVAVGLLVPALVVAIVLVVLGKADPWAMAPLLGAACGGAAVPMVRLWQKDAEASAAS